MSPETQAAAGRTGEIGCWCCGRATSQQALVHLSNHPVVAICINCLHSWAAGSGTIRRR